MSVLLVLAMVTLGTLVFLALAAENLKAQRLVGYVTEKK